MNYEETLKKMADLKKQAKELAEKEFISRARELFDKYPAMNNFSWRQYTPYFRDGDPCEFEVHAEENSWINCEGLEDLVVEYPPKEGEKWSSWELPADHPDKEWREQAHLDVEELIMSFEETLDDVFGEGEIMIHRNGTVSINDCDHD